MAQRKRGGSKAWYLLLLAPLIGLGWPAWYAGAKPSLFGFPFFYWYQFAWVLGAAACTAIVWLALRPRGSGAAPAGPPDEAAASAAGESEPEGAR